jgi:5-enolpyruvylshikimate-3-phosphate synthase
MLVPVEGNMGLFRDENTNAILNCSNSDYDKYLELKTLKVKEANRLNEMSQKVNEIDQLKSDVSEMKDMMKLILKKLDSDS